MLRVGPVIASALAGCIAPGTSSTPDDLPLVPTAPAAPSGRCVQFTDGVPCLDLDEGEPSFSVSDPNLLLQDLDVVDDVNGDGLPELLALVSDTHYLVYGPLTRPIVLPDDANVAFGPGDWVKRLGDATGDGIVDAAVVAAGSLDGLAPVFDLIPGPLPAVVDVARDTMGRFTGDLMDVDLDGRLDLFYGNDSLDESRSLQIWTGAASTWAGPPTATVTHPCPDEEVWEYNFRAPFLGETWPDLDGDRVHEVSIGQWGCNDSYLIPVSELVDDVDLGSRSEAYGPVGAVPDQDGDGDYEWEVAEDQVYSLAAGPLTFDTSVPPRSTGNPVFTLAAGLVYRENVRHVGIDIDGDGVTDFSADGGRTPAGDGVVGLILPGGPSGGLVTGIPSHRIVSTGEEAHYGGGGGWFVHGDLAIVIIWEAAAGVEHARVLTLPRN